jgi:hypothetical protein
MRRHILVATGVVILALSGGFGAVTIGQSDPPEEPADDAVQAISDMIAQAWTPEYDEAKVEAIYDPEVLMMIDMEVYAADREEIKSLIRSALGAGNRYTQIGQEIDYVDEDGDLYLASIVEVTGVAHQTGDPVIGFWRVRDGKVIRHIFMFAPDY